MSLDDGMVNCWRLAMTIAIVLLVYSHSLFEHCHTITGGPAILPYLDSVTQSQVPQIYFHTLFGRCHTVAEVRDILPYFIWTMSHSRRCPRYISILYLDSVTQSPVPQVYFHTVFGQCHTVAGAPGILPYFIRTVSHSRRCPKVTSILYLDSVTQSQVPRIYFRTWFGQCHTVAGAPSWLPYLIWTVSHSCRSPRYSYPVFCFFQLLLPHSFFLSVTGELLIQPVVIHLHLTHTHLILLSQGVRLSNKKTMVLLRRGWRFLQDFSESILYMGGIGLLFNWTEHPKFQHA